MAATQRREISALIMGAPGSGKGTISSKILQDFPFAHISTGDMLRKHITDGTALGAQAKGYMDRGAFVPDDLIIELLIDALAKNGDGGKHLLLDGFPRTLGQALALDKKLKVDFVIDLDIPTATIMERLTDRWIHPGSGRVYAYSYRPPKKHGVDDTTGEALMQRDDDKPEVVKARLDTYYATAEPLLKFYKDRNIVTSFKGTRSDAIYVDVKSFLGKSMPAGAAKK